MSKLHSLILLLLITTAGCVPYKESALLQDTNKNGESFVRKEFEYTLNSGDQLYVEIKTLDEKMNAILSNGVGQNGMGQQAGNSLLSPMLYLQSYSIDSEGDVNLPFIGSVNVQGKSLDGASKAIQAVVDEKLKNTSVNVKMVSYKITIQGEVMNQGVVTVFSDKANIFEVLGLAGGIAEYGDRKNVQVIRTSDKGAEVFSIDLTSKKLFASEVYQLLPNDIIIVNPLKAKNQRLNLPLLNVVLGTISTALGIIILSTR